MSWGEAGGAAMLSCGVSSSFNLGPTGRAFGFRFLVIKPTTTACGDGEQSGSNLSNPSRSSGQAALWATAARLSALLRMNHARRLLLEGTPAADVALRCGFADQSHFNRYFKSFFAVTPMRYARAHAPSARSARTPDMPNAPSALVKCSDR